jgi:hypothetical protein
MTFEILNLLFLYYLFVFAVVFSDAIFVLSVLGIVRIPIPGPFGELWALAFLLFFLEVLIALSFEKEDRPSSVFHIVLAYAVYTKLWAWIVLRGFYDDFVARRESTWAKTERFDTHRPGPAPDHAHPRSFEEGG